MRSKAIFRKRAMHAALVCALLSALALARSSSWPTQTLSQSSPGQAVIPASAATLQTQSRLEAERITLRPTGFEPAEITRPAGRFLLAVNDRSGEESITLLIVRGPSDLVSEARIRERPRKHEWRQVVNLPAGRYELRAAGHSEWRCQITLTGN